MYRSARDLSNAEADAIEVHFEPWGRVRKLATGSALQLEAISDLPGELEVVTEPGRAVVYTWPGGTLRVYDHGALAEDFTTQVPRLPPGKSSREIFGRPGGPLPTRSIPWTPRSRRSFLAYRVVFWSVMPVFAELSRAWREGRIGTVRLVPVLPICAIFLLMGTVAAWAYDRHVSKRAKTSEGCEGDRLT